MPPEHESPLQSLTATNVVIVAGKGGVGKTTVTAVIARAASRDGQRVLVVELDGKPTLDDLLTESLAGSSDESHAASRTGVAGAGPGSIEVVHISAADALDEYLRDHGFARIAKRLNKTGVIDMVGTAAPGIDDVVVLGKVKSFERSGAYDLIVVDGPAAGHAITFLTSATGLARAVRSGPVRTQSDEVIELLTDVERCQVVLVTLPETTPVNEVVETAFALEDDVGVQLEPIVVNGVDTGAELPSVAASTAACRVVDAPAAAVLAEAATFRRSRRAMERAEIGRLTTELPLALVTLPALLVAGLTGRDIDRLADVMTGGNPSADEPDSARQTSPRASARKSPRASAGKSPATSAGKAPDASTRKAPPASTRNEPLTTTGKAIRTSTDDQPNETRLTADLRGLIDTSAVIVCCGSGGVGKTTTAAVLGIEAATLGRKVVVVTIDPARRLADALGLVGGLAATPQRIALDGAAHGEFWAMMLDTTATFDGLVERHAADAEQVERILTNPLYRNMAGAMSGTQEYMAAETLHALHGDERFDLVIVDTPPSRNALDFLEAPGVLARFLDHRAYKLLMLPTKGGLKVLGTAAQPILKAIGRVVGSDVLVDAVAFFQAFAGMETGFRDRATEVMALIRAPETSFVVVASPRHDTIGEAVWFAKQLVEQGVGVGAAIINRTQPAFGDGTARAACDAAADAAETAVDAKIGDDLAALWSNVADLRTLREAELAVMAPLVDVVGAAAVATLPLLSSDVHDLEGLQTIAGHLFGTG